MRPLTKSMRDALMGADLEKGELNRLHISTGYGLLSRGLIERVGFTKPPLSHTTAGGDFPVTNRVKLTADGLRIAREIQVKAL